MKYYDYAVIGAGPGGYVSAIRAAQLGLKTALIEKDERLGGVCLNVGCIPSKALLESSEWLRRAALDFPKHGIKVDKVGIDLSAMMRRKWEVVKTLTDGIAMLMKKNKVTVLHGIGTLTEPGKITVQTGKDKQEITAKTVVLALGGRPVELPFMKFDGKTIVDSTDALSFGRVPKHLIVVGAGAIGLELGSVWSRLGAKVTVVEMLPQIVPLADRQLATLLQRSLKAQGFEFHLNAKVTGATVKARSVNLDFTDKEGKTNTLKGDKILVAVGRKANTDTAGIKDAGVELNDRGQVKVDDHYRTNLPGVCAIGDLIAGPMLAHKASEEGATVAEIAAGQPGHVNYDAIPNIVYTDPELASVGLTEEQAKEKGHEVRVGKFYFRGNGRALSMGESDGMVKLVADAKSDLLLGAHILGPRASELIAELTVAMEFHASAEDIARTVHAHPTLSEAIKEAALAVDKRAVHG